MPDYTITLSIETPNIGGRTFAQTPMLLLVMNKQVNTITEIEMFLKSVLEGLQSDAFITIRKTQHA